MAEKDAITPTSDTTEAPPEQQTRITIEDKGVVSTYVNFCRVMGSPEELVLDMGMNPAPFATGDVTVRVDHRIAMNYFTAKRMYAALQQSLQRHEQVFGVIELNVQRRVTPGAAEAVRKQREGDDKPK